MTEYRFDTAINIRVRVPTNTRRLSSGEAIPYQAADLVGPFVDWLDTKLRDLLGSLPDQRLSDTDQPTVVGALREEGVTEIFVGDETEEAVLLF